MEGGNVLFNDTLNTFYLQLYDVRHMVKDHSDSERGIPLQPHGLLSPISSKGSFICNTPKDRIALTTTFVTPVMEHCLEWEIWCDGSSDWSLMMNTLSYFSDKIDPTVLFANIGLVKNCGPIELFLVPARAPQLV